MADFLHFMNCSRTAPGFFSCAVDCFLEIWLRKISHMFPICSRSYIVGLLKQSEREYFLLKERIDNNSLFASPHSMTLNMIQELNRIRFDVWEYFKFKCPSFQQMDCNAQFSELLQKSVFCPDDFSDREYKVLFSRYFHSAHCSSCDQQVSVNNEVLVNYISLEEMLQSHILLDQWPDFIVQNNTLDRVQCPQCANVTNVVNRETQISDILFVEFSMGMMSVSRFALTVTVCNKEYHLVGLVKHLGMHFTSAVYDNEHSFWIYIDDLQDRNIYYSSLQEMYSHHRTGWFFAAYKQDSCFLQQCDNMNFENVDFAVDSVSFGSTKGNVPSLNIKASQKGFNDSFHNETGRSTYLLTDHDYFSKSKPVHLSIKAHEQDKSCAGIFPEKKKVLYSKAVLQIREIYMVGQNSVQ